MSMDIKSFTDKYEVFDNYNEVIAYYDKEMTNYYDLRDANKRSDNFSKQIIKKQGIDKENRSKMFETLINQGFIINQ